MKPGPPDIVLLVPDWRIRALLRAQLLEEGFEVVATDSWAAMRPHLRPGSKPELVIVDLQGLPKPLEVLRDLSVLMKPQRVLVLTANGTLTPEEVRQVGFHLLNRPVSIAEVVDAARRAIGAGTSARAIPS